MEKRKNKVLSGLMLLGLVMVSQKSYASLSDKFNQYIGSEFANASGFYIILGVIGAGVIGKICQHYFLIDEQKPVMKAKIRAHRHQRPRNVIKKTS